ncbi:hypothetical protein ACSBR1_037995 [Camellia fascicularis]
MSEKLISKLNREVQDGDYWKIVHIPQVRIWYSEPDQSEVKFLWGSVLRMTPRGQGAFEMSAEVTAVLRFKALNVGIRDI